MKKFLIAAGVVTLAFAAVTSAATFNVNLTVGSTGADVVALQTALIAAGYDIPAISSGAVAKGYFGSQTQAAVKLYQAAKGIPNTGFVGPLTRAALNGGSTVVTTPVACPVGFVCTPTGGTATPSTLAGTDGTISDVNKLSQYSNEEVGDGQSEAKVLGLEVEASTDGDIALKSMKIKFTITNGSGSDNLDDYVKSVSVWSGSTKVGSADVSAFNEDSDGVFSKTVTLSGVVVDADEMQKLYVSVDAVSNLDSGDIDSESVTVEVVSIRYEDGAGVTTTEDSTGDLGSLSTTISFVGFADAADTELRISTDSSSPDADTIEVDDNSDTDKVLLLVGKLKLDGDSDVVIDEFPVTLSTNVASTSLAAITNAVTLEIDGEEYSESVSTTTVSTATTTFDNMDLTVEAGSTITFKVYADINDINPTGASSTDMNEGYTLKADVTASNRAVMDVENEEGDDLASGERAGTAVGEYMTFRTEGIYLTLVSVSAVATGNDGVDNDSGMFKIRYKVNAFGDSVYVGTTTTDVAYAVYQDGTSLGEHASSSFDIVNKSDDDLTDAGTWMIEDGDSEEFEVSVAVPLGTLTGAQYRVQLTGVNWTTDESDATPGNTYSSDLDTFKTDNLYLN